MRSESPYSYVMASTGIAGGLGQLCKEIPGLVEALASGEELAIDVSQLSPAGQNAMQRIVRGLNDQFYRNTSNRLAVSARWNSERSRVMVNRFRDSNGPPVVGRFDLFWDANSDMAEQMTLVDPGSGMARILGQTALDAWDGRGSFGELLRASDSEMDKASASDREGFDPGEPLAEHPDDPALLLRKVKIQPRSNLLQDVQSALAESTGFAIVSDSFGRAELYGGVRKSEAEIKALLDEITRTQHYNWDKHGSVIEFRDRDWFRLRSAQIPESRIEPWRQAFKKNGTLDIAELAQIAELTEEQIRVNIEGDEVLSSEAPSATVQTGWPAPPLRLLLLLKQDVLRAYGTLTEDERKRLFSGSGLDISEVSPDRRVAVENAISRRNGAFLLKAGTRITIFGSKAQQGKRLEYTLIATTNDAMDPIVWTFTTPKYEPPKKDESKDKPKAETNQPQR